MRDITIDVMKKTIEDPVTSIKIRIDFDSCPLWLTASSHMPRSHRDTLITMKLRLA